MSEIGLIVTIVLQIILIFTTEFFGPTATFLIANHYLSTVVKNNPIIQEDPQIKFPLQPLFKLLLKPEILPDAQFIDPTLGPIVYEGTWKMFTFLGYGNPVALNNLQFQELADTLYDVKGIWNAYASLIAPNATIRFHRTLSKGLLRWFIPLQNDGLDLLFFNNGNSSDQTILKLDHTIIFDSTTMHSIVNRGSSWSLMLVLDTLRPLEGFPLAFNRLSLGTIARHKLIEEGLQRAAIDLRKFI